jgi:hypothetical protein
MFQKMYLQLNKQKNMLMNKSNKIILYLITSINSMNHLINKILLK